MKTILFIMPRLPFPATSGRKTSLFNYCKILSEKLGYRLVVAAFLESNDNPDLKPDFIDKLVVLPKVTAKEKLTNIVSESFLGGKKPLQVGLFWSKNAKVMIDQIIQRERPDIVIADMVRTTEYLKDVKFYKIADLDDRISLRYKRQLEVNLDGINPYGAYLESMPHFMQCIMLNNFIKRTVVKREIKLIDKYEIEMGSIFDRTIFVAQKEVEEFNKQLGQTKAVAVPIGVDVDYFAEEIEIPNDKEIYIGFLGAMSVAHNENAVLHFIEDIFPIILKKIPKAKFLIVGGGASEKLKAYSSKNVIFTGRVADVREHVKKCKVFVCPMTFGTGIKTKNLEAMAMGIPIVTTSIGAENIHARNGEDWIVEDDKEKFANGVVEIIKKDKLYLKLKNNAFSFVTNNFTWIVAEKAFNDIFHNL